ncbi:hypothetical protein B0T17DRAFT_615096 [Bombardia bombarda]|uniref:Uncharacterized protein n=1 Tax=Bombardia bombarda TaxID=252184 RepID=A0AA39X8J9_9PEZI|nr:hypothetical protein B0T17DRAFT_615096 [Bombardia bombarda]
MGNRGSNLDASAGSGHLPSHGTNTTSEEKHGNYDQIPEYEYPDGDHYVSPEFVNLVKAEQKAIPNHDWKKLIRQLEKMLVNQNVEKAEEKLRNAPNEKIRRAAEKDLERALKMLGEYSVSAEAYDTEESDVAKTM